MENDSKNVKIFKVAALFVGGWLAIMNINNLFVRSPSNSLRTWTIILGIFFIESLITYLWIKESKEARVKLALLFPIIVLLATIAIIFFPLLWLSGWRYG